METEHFVQRESIFNLHLGLCQILLWGVDFAIIVIYERWFKDYLNVTEELHFSLCLSVFCLFYKTQHSDV